MTPSTAAGRALLVGRPDLADYEPDILAIEREAAAAERERIRAALTASDLAGPAEYAGALWVSSILSVLDAEPEAVQP